MLFKKYMGRGIPGSIPARHNVHSLFWQPLIPKYRITIKKGKVQIHALQIEPCIIDLQVLCQAQITKPSPTEVSVSLVHHGVPLTIKGKLLHRKRGLAPVFEFKLLQDVTFVGKSDMLSRVFNTYALADSLLVCKKEPSPKN